MPTTAQILDALQPQNINPVLEQQSAATILTTIAGALEGARNHREAANLRKVAQVLRALAA